MHPLSPTFFSLARKAFLIADFLGVETVDDVEGVDQQADNIAGAQTISDWDIESMPS